MSAIFWNNKGSTLDNLGKYDDAIYCYNKALELDPLYTDAWYNKGLALKNMEKYDDAIYCYNKALELDPLYTDAWSSKGDTYYNWKRYEEAIKAYDKALDLDPNNPEYWNDKGDTYYNWKRYEEAIKAYDKALDLDPNNKSYFYNKGLTLKNMGRCTQSLDFYDKALELDPNNSNCWNSKGIALTSLYNYEDAIKAYDKALELDPNNKYSWYNKGDIFRKKGRYIEAIEYYDNALKIDSDYKPAWNNKGLAFNKLKRYEEAIKAYDKALDLDPDYAISWDNKGDTYSEMGKFQDAISLYDKALELDPNNSNYWNDKGNALDEMGYHNEAIICYDKAIEISKRDTILFTSSPSIDPIKKYFKKSIAVIIGISKYKEENSLANAENDAKGIMNVLEEKYGFATDIIIPLFNEDATYVNIRKIFVSNLQDEDKVGPEDRVIIYYAGHGKVRTRIGRQGQELKYGFIIPYDGQKGDYSSYLEMEMMVNGCRDCLARHTLLILDCCYSGYAAMRDVTDRPKKVTDPYLKQIAFNTAIQVLAAGEEDQPVNDSGIRRGNSAFTGALLDILEAGRDLDNNGILTASEIGSKLAHEVARHSVGAIQRPVFNNISGSGLGDFIFKIFQV